jgi:predicted transcriptional regulator
MTQSEILKLLEKKQWLTSERIEIETGLNQSTIAHELLKLMKQKLIERKEIPKTKKSGNKLYSYRLINGK